MRHNVYGSHLSRTSEQRSLLFRSLIENLFLYKSIQTTEAKAKAVKGLIDRVITQAKEKNHRATMAIFVKNKKALEELNTEILPKLGTRTSGFTGIIRIGQRKGDGAMMVKMSLLLESNNSSLRVRRDVGRGNLDMKTRTKSIKKKEVDKK